MSGVAHALEGPGWGRWGAAVPEWGAKLLGLTLGEAGGRAGGWADSSEQARQEQGRLGSLSPFGMCAFSYCQPRQQPSHSSVVTPGCIFECRSTASCSTCSSKRRRAAPRRCKSWRARSASLQQRKQSCCGCCQSRARLFPARARARADLRCRAPGGKRAGGRDRWAGVVSFLCVCISSSIAWRGRVLFS